MKLHLGCGKRNFGSDWVHIDGGSFEHVSSHDITKLPFESESAELIYSSHVLEYFDPREVTTVLQEWKRVLIPGGILRLAVPDFESMSKLYVSNKCSLKNILGPIYGHMPMNDSSIYHKTVYDFTTIREVLSSVGFSNVERYDWRGTEHAQYDDHSQAYLPHMDKESGTLISLNVECVK